MSACAKTPWGDMPLREDRDAFRVAGAVFRAPRFTDQPFPVRRPPVVDVSAPGEGGPPPLDSPGAAHSVLTVSLPDSALLLLRLIGAHDGVEDEGAIVTRLVAARAEKIGIAALADAGNCVGRAEVARRSHKPEVPGSNPGPATSIHPESEEGREGVPSGAFPLPQGPP